MILSSEISKKCHFISPQNGFPPTLRWCKIFLRSAMKTNKNSCESWDIGLSNALTLISIRLLEKKCRAFFEKKTVSCLPFRITTFICSVFLSWNRRKVNSRIIRKYNPRMISCSFFKWVLFTLLFGIINTGKFHAWLFFLLSHTLPTPGEIVGESVPFEIIFE